MNRPVLPETVKELREFDSPTVANAIELFQVRDRTEGYASMELRCFFPDLKPMVGYAITCTADSTTRGPKRRRALHELFDALNAASGPTVVVVQNVGEDRLKSCFVGDMICTAYNRLGAVGMITNGGVRDLSGIRQKTPDFHIFAAGTVVSHGIALIPLEVNVPVTICGLPVQPGDLLHGDESGLVKVPLDIAESIAEKARSVRDREARVFEYLEGASVSLEGIKRQFPG